MLERRAQEFDAAKRSLTEAMQGISAGFAEYFRTQSKTLKSDDLLDLEEAAALAARYLATLDE